MLAILFVTASLLAQAYLFRDQEASPGTAQVTTFSDACESEYAPYSAEASLDVSDMPHASHASDVSAGENDSSRTPELASNR
jgi:hypothetical protein